MHGRIELLIYALIAKQILWAWPLGHAMTVSKTIFAVSYEEGLGMELLRRLNLVN